MVFRWKPESWKAKKNTWNVLASRLEWRHVTRTWLRFPNVRIFTQERAPKRHLASTIRELSKPCPAEPAVGTTVMSSHFKGNDPFLIWIDVQIRADFVQFRHQFRWEKTSAAYNLWNIPNRWHMANEKNKFKEKSVRCTSAALIERESFICYWIN